MRQKVKWLYEIHGVTMKTAERSLRPTSHSSHCVLDLTNCSMISELSKQIQLPFHMEHSPSTLQRRNSRVSTAKLSISKVKITRNTQIKCDGKSQKVLMLL